MWEGGQDVRVRKENVINMSGQEAVKEVTMTMPSPDFGRCGATTAIEDFNYNSYLLKHIRQS